MANASKKHIGRGSQGKKSGAGAMTDIPKEKLEENMILSNRDKSAHSGERGLDGKSTQSEQFQDQVANRLIDADQAKGKR
jgi:hypothetical protein